MNTQTLAYNALVNHGPGAHRLETRSIAGITADEVLLKVCGCGICAADLRMYYDDWYPPAPVVPGHEFYGTVAAVGDRAAQTRALATGDYITAEQVVPCGACRFCASGQYWMCERQHIHGFAPGIAEGGMAEYVVLGERSLIHKLPISRPDPMWAVVEPLACAIHAVDRANIESCDTVVLAGLGPIGACMLQVIKLLRPHRIIALDTIESRLRTGLKFGADMALNPLTEDVAARVKELTGGYGCDKYINCSGNQKSVAQGLEMLRKLGVYVEFSVFSEPSTVNWTIVGDRKELSIFGAHLSPHTYPRAIEYINSGAVDARSIVTHTFPLEEYEKAFAVGKAKDNCLKIVFVP